jgi:glycosyltransferase involved in cell wall biosynthesis
MALISATIITHNEARNIERAIRSLSCADEVVIVDAESTDGTRAVAQNLGARVLVHPWAGFAAQKNLASDQARYDWILSLDADEELNADAQQAISDWKSSTPTAAGYRFARRARYLGRWILHSGWYPDYKVRLFNRRRGRWKGDYVHESVEVSGPVETLPGEILHYTCDSLDEHRQRIEVYAHLAATELFHKGAAPNLISRTFAPAWVFTNSYLVRLGILDGYRGFLIAWMAARAVRRKYAKWAKMVNDGHPSPEPGE